MFDLFKELDDLMSPEKSKPKEKGMSSNKKRRNKERSKKNKAKKLSRKKNRGK